jgi:hypothetical protein
MSLAVDLVSLVSRRPVADSAEILIGRLVMKGEIVSWIALGTRKDQAGRLEPSISANA